MLTFPGHVYKEVTLWYNMIKSEIDLEAVDLRTKTKGKSNYFIEKEMIELVRQYKSTKSDLIFNKIAPVLDTMINGMINKEFSYNHHVKNNRNDVISECMCEILKSLDRYNPDKGRLFAYLNRIIKNTLIKFYTQSRKVKDKELIYTDLNKNSIEEDEDDIAFKVGLNNSGELISDDTESESSLMLNPSMKNTTLDIGTSIYILYHYITYVKDSIQFYLDNPTIFKAVIKKMKYEQRVTFDFTQYYANKQHNIPDTVLYHTILESLIISLNNILNWLSTTYPDKMKTEPESFDGELSNRAIGYIRKFVKKRLKKENLINHFKVEDLIELIQYLVNKRNFKYGDK